MGMAREALEPEPRQRAQAQIIIFPGVRRERHADPEPGQSDNTRSERDVLELPD
jgi:hypothetical protein